MKTDYLIDKILKQSSENSHKPTTKSVWKRSTQEYKYQEVWLLVVTVPQAVGEDFNGEFMPIRGGVGRLRPERSV